MKKNGILNADISRVLSYMGHTDTIAVADCGLPIPESTERIDLCLKQGIPGFIETLSTLIDEMGVEKIYLAEEILSYNPEVYQKIIDLMKDTPCEMMEHEKLKEKTADCKAVIRTGETTPYANIILQASCLF